MKHQSINKFHENTGLINIYQNRNELTNIELPGTFHKGTRHIDQIRGTRHIYEAVLQATILETNEILPLYHKVFIIKFDLHQLLRIKIPTHTGYKNINKQINWKKGRKMIEDKFITEEIEEKIYLSKNEEDHNRIDREICNIIEQTLYELQPKREKS